MREFDKSNGYEEIAANYIRARGNKSAGIGTSQVAEWSRRLPPGADVLDVGCGTGRPVSQVLIERGFHVHGVDGSVTMVAAFRERFPDALVECASVEDSNFLHGSFDGVLAWGLMFLLKPDVQRTLIGRIASVLRPGGHLLFTSPREACSWHDVMTGRLSVSLGSDEYHRVIQAAGLTMEGSDLDEGENYYYLAQRAADASRGTCNADDV